MRTMHAAVAAVLCLLAAVPACGGRKGAAGMVRSSALGTFPQDSVALLVVEVRKIRALHGDTPWLKDVAALADRQDGPFRDIIRPLGTDVLQQGDRLSLPVAPPARTR